MRPPIPPFMVGTGTTARVAPTRGINAVRRICTMFPQACHCEAAGRGNLLVRGSMLWSFPGDCHVGLRPPRNDVELFGWSFCIKNPRPIRTGDPLLYREKNYFFRDSSTATATETVMPTMGLLPAPRKPIISTWAGTEEEPANWASPCIRPMVSVMP